MNTASSPAPKSEIIIFAAISCRLPMASGSEEHRTLAVSARSKVELNCLRFFLILSCLRSS